MNYFSSLGGIPKPMATQLTWDPKLYTQDRMWGEVRGECLWRAEWGNLATHRHSDSSWDSALAVGQDRCTPCKVTFMLCQALKGTLDLWILKTDFSQGDHITFIDCIQVHTLKTKQSRSSIYSRTLHQQRRAASPTGNCTSYRKHFLLDSASVWLAYGPLPLICGFTCRELCLESKAPA